MNIMMMNRRPDGGCWNIRGARIISHWISSPQTQVVAASWFIYQ